MKALLTIEEAAELTKLSVKTLYTYAEKEKIPHIKLGRRVLFAEDKLEEWVNSCSVIPADDA
jgi:excisionase family DNA binding protein